MSEESLHREESPGAVEESEIRDLLEAELRSARKGLLLRVIPGIAVTAWFVALLMMGAGTPAALLALLFGILTWRAFVTHRMGVARVAGLQQELDERLVSESSTAT